MQSLLAAWRVSLQRTRADWPLVAAALIIAVLAASLLAAGPIYSNAVSLAGLHRVLADAPVTDANVEISVRVAPSDVDETGAAVSAEVTGLLAEPGVDLVTDGRSDSFALPGQAEDEVRDLTNFAFRDGLADHATLVDGNWPITAPNATSRIQVAISEQVSEALGLTTGSQLELVSRLDDALRVPIEITGLYGITDPTAPYWWADASLLTGVTEAGQYRVIGPLIVTREDFLGRVTGPSVAITWYAFPRAASLGIDDVGRLRAGLQELPDRVAAVAPTPSLRVHTDLPRILGDAERSLLVSRTGILLLMIQLAILAGYAIVLTSALIVDHRRIDTALMRSRGAGPFQVAALALAEGALIAIPAALIGPWLAAIALTAFNVAGPLAGIGLTIVPIVSGDAYLVAGLAATGCAVLSVVPALLAARSFAAEQAGRSRQETRTLGQRIGLDVALLAVTGIGLWQLRLYGSPITRTVQGTLGLDPLLVAAPAIALLAGGVVALRLIPLLANLAEVGVARGRDLVGSLGVRQLARRPLRYTRAALLLMLAMSMGVFAVSYATTWTASQRDQADFQAGADVRVVPTYGPRAIPSWAIASAYDSLDGVDAISPAERETLSISRAVGNGALLALDAGTAGQIVSLRSDLSATPLADLFEQLRAERPEVAGVILPGTPTQVRIVSELRVDEIQGFVFTDEFGNGEFQPLDPAELVGFARRWAVVTVRDADGLFHAFDSDDVPFAIGPQEFSVSLAPPERAAEAVAATNAGLHYPLELASIDLVSAIPGFSEVTAGSIGLHEVAVTDGTGAPWLPLQLDAASGWQVAMGIAPGQRIGEFGGVQDVVDLDVELGADTPLGNLPGSDFRGRGVALTFTPSAIADASGPLPAIVTRLVAERSIRDVGQVLPIEVDGVTRSLRIVGIIEGFPTVETDEPAAIVDLPTLALYRYASLHLTQAAEEWWLDVAEARMGDVAERLSTGPLAGSEVTSRQLTLARLSADPLALGIIGALSLGFLAAGLFAVLGLAVSTAVSARQRRVEFALLQAMGLSGRQLSSWLWLESVSLAVVSLLAGTLLGLVIAWVVLPSISVTQRAEAPFPPVLVETPWASVGALELASLVMLGLTLLGLSLILRRAGVGSALRIGED